LALHDTDAAIHESREAFVEALSRGDGTAASEVYAADARLLPPSGELIAGRGAIESFWLTGIDAGLSAVDLVLLELVSDDRMAYEIGRYELRLRPAEGGQVAETGKYVLIHRQQDDGAWYRAVEMLTPDASPAAGADLTL
jgi:ketosteroid isomerase-like protein